MIYAFNCYLLYNIVYRIRPAVRLLDENTKFSSQRKIRNFIIGCTVTIIHTIIVYL